MWIFCGSELLINCQIFRAVQYKKKYLFPQRLGCFSHTIGKVFYDCTRQICRRLFYDRNEQCNIILLDSIYIGPSGKNKKEEIYLWCKTHIHIVY